MTMKQQNLAMKYLVCINNEDYPASLELRKIYRVLPDARAARHGLVRVIDESGEDYLYPADYFASIRLPQLVARKVFAVAT
jgi:hypothetical protein